MRVLPNTKKDWIRLVLVCGFVGTVVGVYGCHITSMPGRSHEGPLPPLTPMQTQVQENLREHVRQLAGEIGVRHLYSRDSLRQAAAYVDTELQSYGYEPTYQAYEVDGETVLNIIAEAPGKSRPEEIVVVGAHYDTDPASPGADDNASGTAALLEMARIYRSLRTERTVRFVAFANEERPFFQTEKMGSLVYARSCRERGDDIVAAIVLESIGYYSTEEGSQKYPALLGLIYPDTGDFIGFVGCSKYRDLVRRCVGTFRGLEDVKMPCEGGAPPAFIDGVSLSDHWSFWQVNYPALMVTDTAPLRNPHYHKSTDLPHTLDYGRAARVTVGVARVVEDLAGLVTAD
jgi:hypothetical protein